MNRNDYYEFEDPGDDGLYGDDSWLINQYHAQRPNWYFHYGRQPVRDRWDIGSRNYYLTYMGRYPFDADGNPSDEPNISGSEFSEWVAEYADEIGSPCEHVPFHHYVPHHGQMNPEQLAWYLYWRTEARDGNFLPTSDSYFFVYVFELINGFGIDDPADLLEKLLALWHAYQNDSGAIRHILWIWIEDTVLLHELMPLESLYAQHLHAWRTAPFTDHLIDYYGAQPLNQMPLSLIDRLGDAELSGLKVYQLGHVEQLQWFIPMALAAVDDQIRGKGKRGIFQRYGPKARHEADRYVYTSAVYNGPRRDVYLPPVRYFSNVRGKLPEILYAVARRTEYQLRRLLRINGRPGLGKLTAEHQAIIERLVAEQYPIYQELFEAGAIEPGSTPRWLERPRPTVTLRQSSILQHNRDADRARDLLLDGLDFLTLETEASPVAQPPQLRVPVDAGSPWEQFGRQLDLIHWDALAALANGSNPAVRLTELSRAGGMMPAQLLDGLNDLAVDLVGDAIVDLSGETPLLYDDYRDEIATLLNDRKD